MNRILLRRLDLVVFVATTAACGPVVQFSQNRQYLLGVPIFLTAIFNGVRESACASNDRKSSEASNV